MTIWLDAQLPPAIAQWLSRVFPKVSVVAVRDLGMRDAADADIFDRAKTASAVLMTKDSDFVDLVLRFGRPPQVVWVTCGNTSNMALQELLARTFPTTLELLAQGEPLVEIG